MTLRGLLVDQNAWRLEREIRLKDFGRSLAEIAKAGGINRRTLQNHHREMDTVDFGEAENLEIITLSKGFSNAVEKTRIPIDEPLAMRLAGILLFLARRVLSIRSECSKRTAYAPVWNKAIGPHGWTQPYRNRVDRNRIVGPLYRFFQFYSWYFDGKNEASSPWSIDARTCIDAPEITRPRILRSPGAQTSDKDKKAERLMRDLIRTSELPKRYSRESDKWIPQGWSSFDVFTNLLSVDIPNVMDSLFDSTNYLQSVDLAWKVALLNQRVLGLVLWSLTVGDLHRRRGGNIRWTGSDAPRWKLTLGSGARCEAMWDKAYTLHRALMHSDFSTGLIPDRSWP